MIKPHEIIYGREIRDMSLRFKTDAGLGRGGFSCYEWKDLVVPGGREGSFIIEGKHVHPVGPFKNWVECSIKLTISPTWGEGGSNSNGYSYQCNYKSYFWGMYYTSDFENLVHRLLKSMCDHFEYHDNVFRQESDDEKIYMVLYKNKS